VQICNLRACGGYHGKKADHLEEEFEREKRDYQERLVYKTLLAVRTGRIPSYQVGGVRFSGTGLTEGA
jgi:hypothetical protein